MGVRTWTSGSISAVAVQNLISRCLSEDGSAADLTTAWCVDEASKGTAEIIAKEPGIIAGLEVAKEIFDRVDKGILVELEAKDGDRVDTGSRVLRCRGSLASLLTAERIVLNILQRMSGIASAADQFCDAVAGTGVRIFDTRKTAPGLREFDKYAVAVGGAENHRKRLDDAVIIKENHVAAAGGISAALRRVEAGIRSSGREVGVILEVESLDELNKALEAGASWVMLDNFTTDDVQRAVKLREQFGLTHQVTLEASGNMSLGNARAYADTGVNVISVGALTHSSRALDWSMLLVRE